MDSPLSHSADVRIRRRPLGVPARLLGRTALRALVVGVALLVAASCSSSSSGTKSGPVHGTITLRLYTISGPNANLFAGAVKLWNEQPNAPYKIKLNTSVETGESFTVNNRLVLSGANPPDFAFMFTQNSYVQPLIDNHLIVDLGPYANQYGWQKRFTPGVWQAILDETKGYNLAYSVDSFPFIYYNKAIFDRLGLTVPNNRQPTLDEFKAYVTAVKNAGYQPIALGNKERWPGAHLMEALAERVVDPTTLAKLRLACRQDTGVKWSDPAGVKILQTVADWGSSGYLANGYNAVDDAQARSLFESGKAAMYSGGTWTPATIVDEAPKFNFGMMHYPQLDASIPAPQMIVPANGLVISSRSKYKDQVAALLNLIVSQQGQQMVVSDYGQFPATSLVAHDPTIKYVHPTAADITSDAAKLPTANFHPQGQCPTGFVTPMITVLQNVFAGSESPESAAKKIQDLAVQNYVKQ